MIPGMLKNNVLSYKIQHNADKLTNFGRLCSCVEEGTNKLAKSYCTTCGKIVSYNSMMSFTKIYSINLWAKDSTVTLQDL
jgi:hypothetical protein